MNIALFGATGATGLELLNQAIQLGHSVTCLLRTPSKLTLRHTNLEIIEGDVLDSGAVGQAVQGQDAVVCALGMPSILDKSRLRERGTANLLKAMDKHDVKRMVCLSAFGTGESRSQLPPFLRYVLAPLFMGRMYADHGAQERLVMGSDLDWVVVRPGTLTNQEPSGSYWHGQDPSGQRLSWKIPRKDVAHFMLQQLSEKHYLRKAVCLSLAPK